MFDYYTPSVAPRVRSPRTMEGRAAMPFTPSHPSFAAMHAAPADAFDLWLSRDLHDLYSAVVLEPIPQELLRVIDGLPEREETRAIGPSRERGTGSQQGFEQRTRERAYFLWLEEWHPEGRAAEHWRLASALQAVREAGDGERAETLRWRPMEAIGAGTPRS
jgi:hypothetical protein